MNKTAVHIEWVDAKGMTAADFLTGENFSQGNLSVMTSYRNLSYGKILSFKIRTSSKITLLNIRFELDADMSGARVMSNGFQTWTGSFEADAGCKSRGLSPLLYNLLRPYGDYGIIKQLRGRGHIRSWTYTYIRRDGKPLTVLGSCSEAYGYTIFDMDMNRSCITVVKDFEGMELDGELEILSLYIGEGEEKAVIDEYFSTIPKYRKPVEKCTGWTSWYNYYTGITEDIVYDNLNALSSNNIPINVFQIDDGYQHAVGDWLEINDKFPSGMKKIAAEISKKGYRPGLWLAPFICEKRSNIYKEHPEWLLKDKHGKLVKAGWNPGWSGTFYSLNIYNEDFMEYLEKVFKTALQDWGFELLKLDFLYGAAVIPHSGRSRGQIMTDAMDFIREQAGEKLVLGCGVPLGPSFNRVDYCRIGSDVAPYWEDWKLRLLNYKERVSTANSLSSTISRRHLNHRVFGNDPDVFILRERDVKMTKDEKYTLFVLNNLLGSLVFFSDNVSEYNEEELNLLKSMYPTVNPNIKCIDCRNNLYKIEFSIDDKNYLVYSNLSGFDAEVVLDNKYYNSELFMLHKGGRLKLRPHRTIVLYNLCDNILPFIIGSKGHIFPGCEIKSFKVEDSDAIIEFHEDCSRREIYIGLDESQKGLSVNGEWYDAVDVKGVRCIVVK